MKLLFFLLLAMQASVSAANELTKEILAEAIQGTPSDFKMVGPGPFAMNLGASHKKLGDEHILSGFRILAPTNNGQDFVWYFNAPKSWRQWGICPIQGPIGPNFRDWLVGDKLYEGLDEPTENDRYRALQTLESDYFKPGHEYVVWFISPNVEDSGDVRGRFAFAPKRDEWDYEAIEESLRLNPLNAEAQVAALESRGGKILLDRRFFDQGYAHERIESMFFSKRTSRQMKSGFFIAIETKNPASTRTPSLIAIRESYGAPDFIETGLEKAKISQHAGQEGGPDPTVDTHYYDFFGFEFAADDEEQHVKRVVTHANNFRSLTAAEWDPSFATIPMKNLTVFNRNSKEVGRIFYFREPGKEPLVLAEPPVGKYRHGKELLEYQGHGVWSWVNMYADDSVARRIPFSNHVMHGRGELYHKGGNLNIVMQYKNGRLDGEMLRHDASGAVIERRFFKDGEQVEE